LAKTGYGEEEILRQVSFQDGMTVEKTVTFGDGRMVPIREVRFWIVTDSGGSVNPAVLC